MVEIQFQSVKILKQIENWPRCIRTQNYLYIINTKDCPFVPSSSTGSFPPNEKLQGRFLHVLLVMLRGHLSMQEV